MQKQKGLGAIEIVIVVAILLIVGSLIYVALKPKGNTTSTPSSSSGSAITSAEDVKSAVKELDQQDVNAVDQELNQLSDSLNSL